MFRLPALVLLALVIALGGGAWSAAYTLKALSGFGAIRLGAWVAYPQLQTDKADPFAKAHRASDGRLLLGRAEGLVFTASTDNAGQSLMGNCFYALSGSMPPARFWTLRVADSDGNPLVMRKTQPTSLDSWTTLRQHDGSLRVRIGAEPRPGNWIKSSGQERITLILTLIDTPAAGSAAIVDLTMPAIHLIGCHNA